MKWIIVLFVMVQITVQSQPSAFKYLPGSYDQFNKSTTFSDYHILDLTQPLVFPSIVVTQKNTVFVINVQYIGNRWLFMERVIFLIGNETFKYDLELPKRKILENGRVFEHGVIMIGTDETKLSLLKSLKNGYNVKIRYEGSSSIEDRQLSTDEITLFTKYVSAYESYLSDSKPYKHISTVDTASVLKVIIFGSLILGVIIYAVLKNIKKQLVMKEYYERKAMERRQQQNNNL